MVKRKNNDEKDLREYIDELADELANENEGRHWTQRGVMVRDDEILVRGIVEKDKIAARIFLTGEVAEDYIGEDSAELLLGINEVCYENGAGGQPLFVETRNKTIRMTRFNPERVWRCFNPDLLVEMARAEMTRLGVDFDPYKMEHMDFYESMITFMKEKYGEDVIMVDIKEGAKDGFYYGVYLSCLLLFGKPGYMDVPVAEHFSQPEAARFLRSAGTFIQLNGKERKELAKLREEYGGITSLTNPEMSFVADLYTRTVKGMYP